MGPAFAGLLAGSVVVETICQIPGLGRFYVQAAFNRDYTMILGTTVFLSTLIVLFNLLSIGYAAFFDFGGAWYKDQESRWGGNVGFGYLFGLNLSPAGTPRSTCHTCC